MPADARAIARLTPRRAAELQRELARRVRARGGLRGIETIAGVDVSERDGRAVGAIAVFRYPGLAAVETVRAERPIEFPYVPGLLAFRELPVLLDAWDRLRCRPDLLLVDGQGRAHPRRFGLACHLAQAVGRPSIGVAKTLLTGAHGALGEARGSRAALCDGGRTIGAALRTRERVRPVYVSVGDRIDLRSAVRVVLACSRGFRLPEPIRAAHRAAGEPIRSGGRKPARGRARREIAIAPSQGMLSVPAGVEPPEPRR